MDAFTQSNGSLYYCRDMPVNQEKLQKLQSARIGGKGTSRRKKKIVHKTATDDKKVQVRGVNVSDVGISCY